MISMVKENDIKDRILSVARERFFKFGFSSVTMDDMAYELGMSKKTLYKHFPSKTDLLQQVVVQFQDYIENVITRIIHNESLDFVEKLRQLWAFLAMELSKVGPAFLQDMQRKAPGLWRDIDRRRREILQHTMGDLINEGVRKKVFRSDVHQQLLLLMYSTLIQGVVNPEVASDLPLSVSQAHEAIRKVFFEGILTEEARKKHHGRRPRTPQSMRRRQR